MAYIIEPTVYKSHSVQYGPRPQFFTCSQRPDVSKHDLAAAVPVGSVATVPRVGLYIKLDADTWGAIVEAST